MTVAIDWSVHVAPPLPQAPYGLSAAQTAGSSGLEVTVFWMVGSEEDQSYTLERARGSGSFEEVGRIAAQAPPTKGANFLDHVPNAQQGETLRYRVRAHNESGDSGYSQELSLRVAAAAMPNPPYGLSAAKTATGNNVVEIRVFWMMNCTNALSYMIERSRGGGPFTQVWAFPAQAPSTIGGNYLDRVSGCSPGETIRYRVRAHNGFGNSAYSEPLSVVMDHATLPVPAVPYGLSASQNPMAAGVTQVHMYWMVGSTGDQSYRLECARAGNAFAQVADVPALNPSTRGANYVHAIAGVRTGDQLRYRVKARNQFGESSYSDALSVVIQPFPMPAVPYGLSASAKPSGNNAVQVHVYWMVSSTGDRAYTLERSRGGGDFAAVAQVPALIPSTRGANDIDTVQNAQPGEKIQYRVMAQNQFGTSGYSDVLSVAMDASALPVPLPPYGLSASKKPVGVNRTETHVYWMVSSLGDTEYGLERALNGGVFSPVANVQALVPSTRGANYVDTVPNTHPGDQVRYRVRGRNHYGYGSYSDELTVRV